MNAKVEFYLAFPRLTFSQATLHIIHMYCVEHITVSNFIIVALTINVSPLSAVLGKTTFLVTRNRGFRKAAWRTYLADSARKSKPQTVLDRVTPGLIMLICLTL